MLETYLGMPNYAIRHLHKVQRMLLKFMCAVCLWAHQQAKLGSPKFVNIMTYTQSPNNEFHAVVYTLFRFSFFQLVKREVDFFE